MKGLLAFDIDGTLATSENSIPTKTVAALARYAAEGWRIAFITGRTFAFSQTVLQTMLFPYHLAVHNGAIVLQMPEGKVVTQRYLPKSLIEQLLELEAPPFLVCLGPESGSICYYTPADYTDEHLEYFARRRALSNETWVELDDLSAVPVESFPVLKWFAPAEVLHQWRQNTEVDQLLQFSIIRDGFSSLAIAQGTDRAIHKGWALEQIRNQIPPGGIVVAAGDESNDREMLLAADKCIVIATAPQAVLQLADVVAAPPAESGVVAALEILLDKERE